MFFTKKITILFGASLLGMYPSFGTVNMYNVVNSCDFFSHWNTLIELYHIETIFFKNSQMNKIINKYLKGGTLIYVPNELNWNNAVSEISRHPIQNYFN